MLNYDACFHILFSLALSEYCDCFDHQHDFDIHKAKEWAYTQMEGFTEKEMKDWVSIISKGDGGLQYNYYHDSISIV